MGRWIITNFGASICGLSFVIAITPPDFSAALAGKGKSPAKSIKPFLPGRKGKLVCRDLTVGKGCKVAFLITGNFFWPQAIILEIFIKTALVLAFTSL